MFERNGQSQDLISLWNTVPTGEAPIEVHMVFDHKFPVFGGTTGHLLYNLGPLHSESHLREEISAYLGRYSVQAKFILRMGKDILDDVTYTRAIANTCRGDRVLRIIVTPLQINLPKLSTHTIQDSGSLATKPYHPVHNTLMDFARAVPITRLRPRNNFPTITRARYLVHPLPDEIDSGEGRGGARHFENRMASLPSHRPDMLTPFHTSRTSLAPSHFLHGTMERRPCIGNYSLRDKKGNDPLQEEEELMRRHDIRTLREEHARDINKQKLLASKIEHKTLCRLCGIDIDSEKSVQRWIRRYHAVFERRNMRAENHALIHWQKLLRERLGGIAKTFFFEEFTQEPFFVHKGCVDITWDWHMGHDMSKIVLEAEETKCDLCRERGATCSCTQPNCEKVYHTSCAFFSPGLYPWGMVSFGALPQLRKCAKCPTHREHEKRRHNTPSTSLEGSCEDVLDPRTAAEYCRDIRHVE